MKVKNLIKLLTDMPSEALVVLSKDSEGNGFSPLSDDFSIGHYVPDNTWSGEFTTEGKRGKKAICLWPTN